MDNLQQLSSFLLPLLIVVVIIVIVAFVGLSRRRK